MKEDNMSNKIKTYHVRCGNFKCIYNHAAICYAGILTLNECGVCLCCINKKRKDGEE